MIETTLPDADGAGGLYSAVVLTTEYDGLGRVIAQTDGLGKTTNWTYTNYGRTVTVALPDPDGGGALGRPQTTSVYDSAGRILERYDPVYYLNTLTTWSYDNLGRLSSVTGPDPDIVDEWEDGPLSAPVTSYEYDKLGNLRFETDPNGNVTERQYDERNRLKKIILPDPDGVGGQSSPELEYGYDDAGQLIWEEDALGNVTTYAYDGLGRRTSVTTEDPDDTGPLDAAVTLFEYDAAGRLRYQTDPNGIVTGYYYDALDNLIEIRNDDPIVGPTSNLTLFTYDAVGNRLSLTDPAGNTTEWVYDDLNRVSSETNELAETRTFVYNAAGSVTKITDRRGLVREFTYDFTQRLKQEKWKDGVTVVNTIDFTYDYAFNLVAASDDYSSYSYTYDYLGRPFEIIADNGGPLVKLIQGFDANNNRTSLAVHIDSGSDYVEDLINTYEYDGLNRLIQLEQTEQTGNAVADKRVDLSYLATGQFDTITRYDDLAGGGGNEVATSVYGYDLMNRLTSLTHTHSTTTIADYSWVYDDASRIIEQVFDSLEGDNGESVYDYDNTNQLIDADHDYQTDEDYTYDENGNRTMAGYVTGDNNQLLSNGVWDYAYDEEGNRESQTPVLWRDLIGYWRADESSGNLLDALGDNNLTETSGTIAAATGKVNGARDFEAGDTEYFTKADNAALSTGDIDFTGQAWVKLESKAATQGIMGKWSADQYEYLLYYDAGLDRFRFAVTSSGLMATVAAVAANNLGSPSTATWYQILFWHNAEGHEIGIRVNNGTANTVSHSAGVHDGTSGFTVGRIDTGSTVYFDGLIDEVAFWKRLLTSAEQATLYNAGAGAAIPNEKLEFSWDHRNRLTQIVTRNLADTIVKQVDYTYDYDRRIAKLIDNDGPGGAGAVFLGFAYDGIHELLEYNSSDELTRRNLYGNVVDQIFASEEVSNPAIDGDVLWALGARQTRTLGGLG